MATIICNGGHAITTNRFIAAGTEPLNVGWGTGAGTAAITDTDLFTPVLVSGSAGSTDRTAGTSSRQTTTNTNDTYQVIATRTATGAVAVTNMGTFDAVSGGNMYVKGDFSVINLASGDAIQATVKVKFS